MTFATQWIDCGVARERALSTMRARYPDWIVFAAMVIDGTADGWKVHVMLRHTKLGFGSIDVAVSRFSHDVTELKAPAVLGPPRN